MSEVWTTATMHNTEPISLTVRALGTEFVFDVLIDRPIVQVVDMWKGAMSRDGYEELDDLPFTLGKETLALDGDQLDPQKCTVADLALEVERVANGGTKAFCHVHVYDAEGLATASQMRAARARRRAER